MTAVRTAPRRRLRAMGSAVALVLLAAAVPVALNLADAAGPFSCSASHQIDETMANGARWRMCWEKRNHEGIVLHDVTYTPPGGQPVEVLSRASLAEIHVPYDNNGARFHDVSDFGLGVSLDTLDTSDCPDGTLIPEAGTDILCLTEGAAGYSYKDYDAVAQTRSLNLFSASCIGAYCYVVAWNFDSDGTIRPEVGATGSLQMYGGPANASWPVGGGRRAVAHMHNYYWRLDFDVAGAANDRVEELEASPVQGSRRARLANTRRAFLVETARSVYPGHFRSWRIHDLARNNADGHPVSFEILPNPDHVFRGPSWEPFTRRDLYVTRLRPCELFATHNPPTGFCRPGPNDQVAAFANGEDVRGQDLVLWYSSSFHHLPRDEDEEHMHPHWTGFSIVPRDLTATNPG